MSISRIDRFRGVTFLAVCAFLAFGAEPATAQDPCSSIACQPWQVCEVYPPTQDPYCADTCNGFDCPTGRECELVDVDCVNLPCPPVATCVIDPVVTCSLPAEVGPCDAAIQRWYHNAHTGTCLPFVYGGCAGNTNNFPTLDACEGTCVTVAVPSLDRRGLGVLAILLAGALVLGLRLGRP